MESPKTTDNLLSILAQGGDNDLALVVPDGPRLTYRQLREQVNAGASMLAGLGIGQSDRVAMALPNGPEALVVFLAAAAVAACAPLNPAYKEDEYRFYLDDLGAGAMIIPRGGGEAARRALPPGCALIEAVIDDNGVLELQGATGGSSSVSTPPPSGDDVALLLHTSGTTSRPKLVPLRHRNLLASTDHIASTYALTSDDVSLCVMPLFHVHGLVASALSTLRTGGTVVVPRQFNPLGFWSLVREHRVTWYSAVPTIHQMLLMRLRGERPAGTDSLRFIRSCSSALAPETMEQLETSFGVPVLEAYGMTEASHQIASNPLPPGRRLPGSVGQGTGVSIGVMGDGEDLLPAGERGEVVIKGPNVIIGYESNPKANAESFPGGWFRTGDLGVMDGAGYLTLISRIKELINRGGEKIAPGEIDTVLRLHADVAEAVAFAMPHRTWGEEVGAAVVLHAGAQATSKDLIAHCRDRLADFKVPRAIYIADELPRTATGKIQRRHVAAAFLPGE